MEPTSNFLETVNYFFYEGFDVGVFRADYPVIYKYLKERKFDDFFLELIRTLKRNKKQIFSNAEVQKQIKGLEKGIEKVFVDGSKWHKQYLIFEGLNQLPYSYFPELKKIAEGFLKELATLTPQRDKKVELTIPQLALIYYYKGISITRKNGIEIAQEYGHNSGEKLFQIFSKYSSRQNRIGQEDTRKKNLNKIALLEFVISRLSGIAKQKAVDELCTLKASFERDYQ